MTLCTHESRHIHGLFRSGRVVQRGCSYCAYPLLVDISPLAALSLVHYYHNHSHLYTLTPPCVSVPPYLRYSHSIAPDSPLLPSSSCRTTGVLSINSAQHSFGCCCSLVARSHFVKLTPPFHSLPSSHLPTSSSSNGSHALQWVSHTNSRLHAYAPSPPHSLMQHRWVIAAHGALHSCQTRSRAGVGCMLCVPSLPPCRID